MKDTLSLQNVRKLIEVSQNYSKHHRLLVITLQNAKLSPSKVFSN